MLKGVIIKFDSTTYDSAVELDSYSLVGRDRVNKLGGSVCTYTKSYIPFKVLSDLQDECFESLCNYLRPYKLPLGFSCLIVCVIYHPPANDNNALIDHITSKLDLALTKHPNAGIFLVGDFNRCPGFIITYTFRAKTDCQATHKEKRYLRFNSHEYV